MTEQTQQDPRSKHRSEQMPPHEDVGQPGLTAETGPTPDHGEQTWQGHGRLEGRRTLITGGDSGIGRAVAIAFAREGSDVAINYLPEEQEDAEATAELIREAGQQAFLYPQDLSLIHI